MQALTVLTTSSAVVSPMLAVILVIAAPAAAAWCSNNFPGAIFCDDFGTYCDSGGYPGGAGAPAGPPCNPADPVTANGQTRLRSVWYRTSTTDGTSTPCGTEVVLDNSAVPSTTYFYPSSLPFAGRYPGLMADVLAQYTFRDWVLSLAPPAPQVLDLRRFISNAYGPPYAALAATDATPLVLTYQVDSEVDGKLFYSDGFLELAHGLPGSPLNRANTDYVFGPACATYCNPVINQGPFPIICAQGNPEGGLLLPTACPADPVGTAPLHNAIAVGILAMVDPDPCHCGSGQAHAGTCYHPVFFDGKVWWNLRSNSPRTSTGMLTPLNGAPASPPADINVPGKFTLWHAPLSGGVAVGGPHNWITMTVKTSTVKFEMTTIETSSIVPGAQYQVYSVMDGVPRRYLGPFNTMRSGVGPGCELASGSWNTCAAGTSRTCMNTRSKQSRYVEFDDLALSQGTGYMTDGACCLPNASCLDFTSESACLSQGGEWRGVSTMCSTQVCCPTPVADSDHDSDVDVADFGMLQRCLTYQGTTSGNCSCFDHNGDNVLDQRDVESFVTCATGPAVVPGTVPPECVP